MYAGAAQQGPGGPEGGPGAGPEGQGPVGGEPQGGKKEGDDGAVDADFEVVK
jgi:hypothetical protein